MPLTEVERAYFAGLLDGEGSISLVRSFAKRTNGRYIYPLVRLANTNEAMILWCRARIPFGAQGYTSKLNDRCKDVVHLAWASGDAIKVLELALPYLVTKKPQAEIVLEMWSVNAEAAKDAGGKFGHGRPLPDWLIAHRQKAFDELALLNKRGI